jgi:peptidoglycan hydrolase CwlO-like protein
METNVQPSPFMATLQNINILQQDVVTLSSRITKTEDGINKVAEAGKNIVEASSTLLDRVLETQEKQEDLEREMKWLNQNSLLLLIVAVFNSTAVTYLLLASK